MKAVLIGFGDVAPRHLEVLQAQNCEISGIVTKNPQNAISKSQKYNLSKAFRSIDEISNSDVDFFLVMVNPEFTFNILKKLIPLGKPILVEKPVSFSSKNISELIELESKYNCKVFVAMNRRFYSIYEKALNFLSQNNLKLDYISIEAPERFSDIMREKFSENTRENWMYCNPIHCIDLLRFFGGDLTSIMSNSTPENYVYSALGTLSNNIKFSYLSNWNSPGNWSVILYAKNTRIVFNPLEKGVIYSGKDSIELKLDEVDILYKAGFVAQLETFLEYSFENKNNKKISDLKDHQKTLELIEKIYFP